MALLPIPFANHATYPGHSGVDFAQPRGTIFRASGPGVMQGRWSNPRGGNLFGVKYDGYPSVFYAHLDNYADVPAPGTRLNEGDVIGHVGNSGNSTGPHLHMEVEGHATTAGFWQFFDPNRVVGGGGGTVGPTQRQVVPNAVANGRAEPSSQSPLVGEPLAPNTIGNFDGWINGENVEGNSVWFRGTSGRWFWSGGFTDHGTHDLADLNPPSLRGYQRQVVGHATANGRSQPTTTVPVEQELPPGTIADFDGWIRGESVEGNDVWFRGMYSKNFFWSGGFTDHGTHDLLDLNPITPSTDRTVGVSPANVRALPYTSSPVLSTDPGGTVIAMNAFTRAESVDGQDIWFRRVSDGNWMWAGGFTSQSVDGIPEVAAPPPPDPTSPNNPRGLPEYEPVWPLAAQGLEAPLGFTDCEDPEERASRAMKGNQPVSPIIDRYMIHWTGGTADQLDYFSYCNDRSVCPTTYMRRDGWQSEMIRPGAKPATNGQEWNYRIFAVETLAGPDNDFTDEQWEAHAQNIALLAEFDGQDLDGIPVSFKIDREHVLGHRETANTTCPGDAQMEKLDWLIERAQEIYDENNPPIPTDDYIVPKSLGDQIRELVLRAFPPRD